MVRSQLTLPVKKGDYIWCGTTSRGRVVAADTSGTSVSFTSKFDQSVTANTFIIYPAIAMFEDDSSNLRGMYQGRTGGLSVSRINIANTDSDESSIAFLTGSGVPMYSANSNGTQFHITLTNTNGAITFGGGFSMGNQAISNVNNIQGGSTVAFAIAAQSTFGIDLNKNTGGAVRNYGGTGTVKVQTDSTGIGFYGVSTVARPATGGAASTFVANTSAIANDTATFDGYTIGGVVKALRNLGLLT